MPPGCGDDPPGCSIPATTRRPAGSRSIELCTTTGRRPTGIVASNVNAAMGVLLGAREIGLKVPDQLSVVAIHDSWFTDYASPSLTTVRMPMYQLGQEAVRLLHLRLMGERPIDLMVTDPAPVLVKRDSSAPPPEAPRPGSRTQRPT